MNEKSRDTQVREHLESAAEHLLIVECYSRKLPAHIITEVHIMRERMRQIAQRELA